MPSDWPQTAHPVTRVIGGDGSTSASFIVPAGVIVRVESVYAELDTSVGIASPLLTITDDSGAVIAKKRQAEDVDNFGTSSATWALRLADEPPPPTPPPPIPTEVGYYGNGTGQNIPATSSTLATWAFQGGTALLNLTTPTIPTFTSTGVYILSTTVAPILPGAGWVAGLYFGAILLSNHATVPAGMNQSAPWKGTGTTVASVALSMADNYAAGDSIRCFIENDQATAGKFGFGTIVQRIA